MIPLPCTAETKQHSVRNDSTYISCSDGAVKINLVIISCMTFVDGSDILPPGERCSLQQAREGEEAHHRMPNSGTIVKQCLGCPEVTTLLAPHRTQPRVTERTVTSGGCTLWVLAHDSKPQPGLYFALWAEVCLPVSTCKIATICLCGFVIAWCCTSAILQRVSLFL